MERYQPETNAKSFDRLREIKRPKEKNNAGVFK